MDIKDVLNKYQNIVNKELYKYIKKEDCIEKTLYDSIEYSLMAGGKRLRPILMLQTYTLFKHNYEKCLPFAVAIEMIHNFSLIHDDLPAIDNDDFRHGKLTNHKKFSESTAILAGDSLLNNAYMVISKELFNNTQNIKNKLRAFNELTKAVDRMIAGEYLDTEYEYRNISKEYLEYIHKNKTGKLIKASIRIGAILADASENQINELSEYADKIGLTFQISDDILSETGEKDILGKPIGNDKRNGKCTYVTKYGLKKAQEILKQLTKQAVNIANTYGADGEFFKEFAIYIKNRDK